MLTARYAGQRGRFWPARGRATIFLAASTSGAERLKHMARLPRDFLYYVSVTGITGARTELPPELVAARQEVRSLVKCPLAVGFGISTPEQVRWLSPQVDGIVVGSAIVPRVARLKGPELVKEVGEFVASLKASMQVK